MIKKQVLELLEKSSCPLSVSDILAQIAANKTTIYRELEEFVTSGIVGEVNFGDGKKRYELTSHGHHHHLVCNGCGKIQDVEIDEKTLLNGIYSLGFKIEQHSVEFFGKCSSCQI